MNAIGIDLGGSKTLAVLLNSGGKVLRMGRIPSSFRSKKECVEKISSLIETVAGGKEFSGICVASRGFIDRRKGEIKGDVLFPFLSGMNFRKELSRKFRGKRILVENDSNCFVFAEHCFGSAKGMKNVVGLTLGTGIGGGIIADGKLYLGKGSAAEIGHMVIDFRGRKKFKAGRKGSVESLANASAVLKRAREKGLRAGDSKELLELARRGNKTAEKAWEECGRELGIGLANIVCIFDPEAIVIGGGLANAWDEFVKPAVKKMKKELLEKSEVKVKKAQFVEIGAAVGAAHWLLSEESRKFWKKKRPLFAVDAVIKYFDRGKFKGLVLVDRKKFPYGWSLPGGIVEYGETAEEAMVREAREETGLKIKIERQFRTYSSPKRDPRYHTVSLAFVARASGKLRAGSDARSAEVFSLKKIPKNLCFSHGKVVREAGKFLK